jgi:hypothetical protein
MISSEVERTLVKSPPELWTELSNPDALARHLGEFGDIRITRVEPEREVAWEAGDTAGTVRIKPSGWGTKVTLTATKEVAAAEQPVEVAPSPEPASAPASAPAPEAQAEPPAPELSPDRIESTAQSEAVAPARTAVEFGLELEPRLGFFRRLLGGGRGRKVAAQPQPPRPDPFVAIRQALSPETMTIADPFSMPRSVAARPPDESETAKPPDHTADISADLEAAEAAEEVAAKQVTAVLTSVLDRLGAAHHRPFSRA